MVSELLYLDENKCLQSRPPRRGQNNVIENISGYLGARRLAEFSNREEWLDQTKLWRFLEDPTEFICQHKYLYELAVWGIRFGSKERDFSESWKLVVPHDGILKNIGEAKFFCCLMEALRKSTSPAG